MLEEELLISTARVNAVVHELPFELWAAASLAAARQLRHIAGPDAARARQYFEPRARQFALPGELPVF